MDPFWSGMLGGFLSIGFSFFLFVGFVYLMNRF
jgi:hypothetical protein